MPEQNAPEQKPAEDTISHEGDEQNAPEQTMDEVVDIQPEYSPDYQSMLEEEERKLAKCDEKYKRALADYRNLERRTEGEIERRKNQAADKMLREFLDIYDDFRRARDSYYANGTDTTGLDSVIKNSEAMLQRYNVAAMDSMGKPFDPRVHEALSTKQDPTLEEQTIIQEIRKGYIIKDRVLRTALVVVSIRK